GPHLIDRLVLRLCELLEQLLDPAGLRLAGVDDIDINVITVVECSEAFGEICHRRVDRTADQEIRPWRARGTPTILTILPWTCLSSGQNSRVSRTVAWNFSAKPSVHRASDCSKKLPPRGAAALLTRTSRRLKCSLTLAKTCSQASSVRRSPATVTACGPPAAATVLAPSARLAELAAARTVRAPSRAKAIAIARPMPRLPPLTTPSALALPWFVQPLYSAAGRVAKPCVH